LLGCVIQKLPHGDACHFVLRIDFGFKQRRS